jgi:putative tryptophan/tyrosine transport system substrate-binding protein
MRRRSFIGLVAGAAAWPITAGAQQAIPVIGFLNGESPVPFAPFVAAFRQGLGDAGFTEGSNVAIEYRWAEGQNNRLPTLTADLVRQQVSVIVATGGNDAALAAKAATTKIPIVFAYSRDPVALGLVASLNRPGGNATGVNMFTAELEPKRLGLLRALVPTATLMAVLLNSNSLNIEPQLKDVWEAARTVGQQIHVLQATGERELDAAFATLGSLGVGALLVGSDPYFYSRREQIIALAARHAIPTIYQVREFAKAGGLMSYGTSLTDAYRQVGVYTGRVLKGERTANLPVMQSIKFELAINLKTAKALGLDIPATLLALADEVIE